MGVLQMSIHSVFHSHSALIDRAIYQCSAIPMTDKPRPYDLYTDRLLIVPDIAVLICLLDQ